MELEPGVAATAAKLVLAAVHPVVTAACFAVAQPVAAVTVRGVVAAVAAIAVIRIIVDFDC